VVVVGAPVVVDLAGAVVVEPPRSRFRVGAMVAGSVVGIEVGGPEEVGRAVVVGLAEVGTAADTGADVATTRSDDSHPGGGPGGSSPIATAPIAPADRAPTRTRRPSLERSFIVRCVGLLCRSL